MRKAVVAVVLAAGFLWLAIWVGSLVMRDAVSTGRDSAWPMGLETLSEAAARDPVTAMSPAAARLAAAAEPLGIDLAPRTRSDVLRTDPRPMEFVRRQLAGWVREQLSVPTPDIASLPAESGEYLAGRGAELAAVGAILRSGEPIVWPQDVRDPAAPLPNLLGHTQLQRVLIGRALDRASIGDPGAWDDLYAAWILARSLSSRREMISALTSLAMARRADAAARKMPLPFPAWLQDMQAFDYRRTLLSAWQRDAWSVQDAVYAETSIDGSPLVRRAVDAVMSPYTRMSASDLVEQWRRAAFAIAASRECQSPGLRTFPAWWNVPARAITAPNMDASWHRLLRFTAEREATIRALRLREGAAPMRQSSCADG
ncbi:MAG: hypothetical protein ACXW28_14820, partial [Thermoanaerobaculia bacterium]